MTTRSQRLTRYPARPRAVAVLVTLCVMIMGLLAAAPASAASGTSQLAMNEQLQAGQSLVSPNGLLRLVMQGDGNLVLYAPERVVWQSHTDGHAGAWAQFNPDGNFVIYDAQAQPLWSTFQFGGAAGGTFLQVQDDGNIVQYTPSIRVTWSSNTVYGPPRLNAPGALTSGQRLMSPNGAYTLRMEPNGELTFYGPNGAWLWKTPTVGSAPNLYVQPDGNLVIYNSAGVPTWNSSPTSAPGFFQVQDDGNVVLYTAGGAVLWSDDAATNLVRPSTVQPTAGEKAVAYARQQIGKWYKYGAAGPDNFDCSGLTMMSWRQAGVALTRTAHSQYTNGKKLPAGTAPAIGDLIFYGTPWNVTHVAIYSGAGKMIEAPSANLQVREVATRATSLQLVRPTG